MSAIGGAGSRPRIPQEDLGAEPQAGTAGAASETAASTAAQPARTSIRWFDFKDMKSIGNVRFLRDGGTATFEGKTIGYDLAFRYDGAIRSPTRGQVFVKNRDGRGTERALNENERKALTKQLEKLGNAATGQKARDLELLVGRLKSTAPADPVAPPSVRIPEKVREAVFGADAGRFPKLGNQPDRQYVAVDGAKKLANGGYEVTLATYRTSIAGPIPGHQGKVEGSERTYRYSKDGAVELTKAPRIGGEPSTGPVKLKSLTTDRIVHMTPSGNEVRIGIGIGAGLAAQGGVVGLEVDGRKFEVPTRRGDDAKKKLDDLRAKIEAGGYKVTEQRLRGIDTIELNWKIERAGGPGPARGVVDLGMLADPGATLGGSTRELKPGQTLRFTTSENQIRGMNDLVFDPPGALQVERKAIERPPAGLLGGMTKWEYRITVPARARPGTTVEVKSQPNFQVRNDPDWKFGFKVKVANP